MWGSIISAGISAAGGLGSSLMGSNSAEKAAKENAKMQREFAQNGVTWKAADAVRANKEYGIHPLVGMGAQTVAATPSYVGADYSGIERGMTAAGQNIGRAVNAGMTPEQKELHQLAIAKEKATINNINADTARIQGQQVRQVLQRDQLTNSPFVSNGKAPQGQVVTKPAEVISAAVDVPSTEAGYHPNRRVLRSGKNDFRIVPSEAQKSANEDSMLGEVGEFVDRAKTSMWGMTHDELPMDVVRKLLPPNARPSDYLFYTNPLTGDIYTRRNYLKVRPQQRKGTRFMDRGFGGF